MAPASPPSPASSTSTVDQQEIILDNLNSGKTTSSTTVPKKPQKKPRRPKLSPSSQQVPPWKALQHHFLRYTDVKFKPDRRTNASELSNGWKTHHLVGQLDDLMQIEEQSREKISHLLDLFSSRGARNIYNLVENCHKLPEQHANLLRSQKSYGRNEFSADLIITKMDDLLRGDLQRINIFHEQLSYCKDILRRLTDEHRDRAAKVATKQKRSTRAH